MLSRGGVGLTVLLVLLQTVRAVVPVAQALAVGRLVAVLLGARTAREAAVSACLVWTR